MNSHPYFDPTTFTPSVNNPAVEDTKRASGTEKLDHSDLVRAVMLWPGTYDLAECIEEHLLKHEGRNALRRRGRRSPYPVAAMLATWISVRAYGSLASCVTALRNNVWTDVIRPAFEEVTGTELPLSSPNKDQLEYFRDRLEEVGLEAPLWQDLQEAFQRVAVAQAQVLGNLTTSQGPDWAHPTLANAIIGDGTVMRPRCDAPGSIWDPSTQRYRWLDDRGRMSERPPPSATLTDLSTDEKSHLRGLNMVSYLTQTEHGWVVLGTSYAEGAEQWPALDLLDSIADIAGGGVHTVLYDGVFTGWLLGYTLARHRARVLNKHHADKQSGEKQRAKGTRP